MKEDLETKPQSKKISVNCFDLDGTLTKYEADKDYESFLGPKILTVPWKEHLVNYLQQVKDAKAFHDGVIQDTPDEMLARAIKLSIQEGEEYNAILTFNASPVYTKIILAMMGLVESEISKLFIRNRRPEDSIENKNEFIKEALAHFKSEDQTLKSMMIKDPESIAITLMDDNEDNINAAVEYGIKPFLVPETVDCKCELTDDSFEYLRAFMDYQEVSKEDLLKVKLPSMEERLDTAKRIISQPLIPISTSPREVNKRRVLSTISANTLLCDEVLSFGADNINVGSKRPRVENAHDIAVKNYKNLKFSKDMPEKKPIVVAR